ncbi:hypothetical protein AB0I28_32395 [Phytomonospora sp. NPDC050363]|uniref:hypothetical protein n=1 Tax=Phytomonospora sp. NPDC050363 TaxID=3155642 RepID=UPI00340584CC
MADHTAYAAPVPADRTTQDPATSPAAPAVEQAPPVPAGPSTVGIAQADPAAPAFGPPQPAPKKSKAVPILSLVTGLLLVAAIVLTVVLASTAGKLTDTRDALVASEQTTEDLTGKNTSLNGELEDTQEELDDATEANEALAACIDEVEKFFEAVAKQSNSALEKAIKGMDKTCDEADDYR